MDSVTEALIKDFSEFVIIQAKSSSSFDGAAIIALGDNLVKEVFAPSQQLPMNDDVKRLIEIKERISKMLRN